MIIKLDEKININKLLDYLNDIIKKYPPNMKSGGAWGGWSVTSSNGEVEDGWQTGEKLNDPEVSDKEKEKLKELFKANDFNTPTPIFNGYIKEVLDVINKADPKIKVSRIRIAILRPHDEKEAYWHRDGDSADLKRYFRLHIPIITNDQCFFDYENERHHLAADGSIYLIEISQLHRAVNLSNEDRYHLIMNVSYIK